MLLKSLADGFYEDSLICGVRSLIILYVAVYSGTDQVDAPYLNVSSCQCVA